MGRRALRLCAGRIELVTLAHEHVPDLAALRMANSDDLHATSASRHRFALSVEGIARSLRQRVDAASEDLHPLVILRDGAIVGDLNLSQISRAAEESANVGVLVDATARRQGIATVAIGLGCRLAFEQLGLHRLQAGIQPGNVGSRTAFIRNDFELIGLARGYLFVDGAWRDHLLFQRLVGHG